MRHWFATNSFRCSSLNRERHSLSKPGVFCILSLNFPCLWRCGSRPSSSGYWKYFSCIICNFSSRKSSKYQRDCHLLWMGNDNRQMANLTEIHKINGSVLNIDWFFITRGLAAPAFHPPFYYADAWRRLPCHGVEERQLPKLGNAALICNKLIPLQFSQ